jgi:mono/diheme cytochrome c family protein
MEHAMRRAAAIGVFLIALSRGTFAQAQDGAAFDDTQKLGQQLFYQSCVVCHTKPQITSGQYGPVLSKNTLNGDSDALRAFIRDGTARMPGFKFQFEPAQIDAIVAYLKTVPAPAASAPTAR